MNFNQSKLNYKENNSIIYRINERLTSFGSRFDCWAIASRTSLTVFVTGKHKPICNCFGDWLRNTTVIKTGLIIFCGIGNDNNKYGSNVLLSFLQWLQRNVECNWALNVDVMILWLASVYSNQARWANSDEDIKF